MNCSTLRERAAGSSPSTSQVSLIKTVAPPRLVPKRDCVFQRQHHVDQQFEFEAVSTKKEEEEEEEEAVLCFPQTHPGI